ncbi:MAG TPA: hypothetical protein PLX71_01965 [Phycicoccus sp.]|nr:hypothetical protein [Phycicoccus sp.]
MDAAHRVCRPPVTNRPIGGLCTNGCRATGYAAHPPTLPADPGLLEAPLG